MCPVCVEQKARKDQKEREEKMALYGKLVTPNKRQSILDEHFDIKGCETKVINSY